MKPISVRITIDSIRARQDRSLGMSISTPELNAPQKVLFMELQGIECECTIRPLDSSQAPVEIKSEMNTKTPSMRLRNTIFVYWKQLTDSGKITETFETWYPNFMEKIILQIKEKLEE
jgi:hypothetical protein